MKRILALTCMLLLLAAGAAVAEDARLTVVLATDMHYLSPSLTDYVERFMNTVYAADGKTIHYSPQICRAFVRDMLRLRPDAVILSGDLTLNGAPVSHQEFAAMLKELADASIPVLTMPGNHDVGGQAYSFGPNGVIGFPAATNSGFLEIYEPFGFAGALSREVNSLSYVSKLSEDVWAVMLDVNANGKPGLVRAETLAWLEEQLQAAQAAGVTVIGVSHQNLLPHNKYFTQGVMISQPQKLQALYRQYGVRLNLSGHTHMQHITALEDTVEIVTSSMVLSPCYYGVITLDGGQLKTYEAVPVDVEGWARETGETNPDLLDFRRYDEEFYREVVRRKVTATVAGLEIPEEDKQRMIDFGVELSVRDFAGTRGGLGDAGGMAFWEKYLPNSVFTYYLKGAVTDGLWDMNRYDFTGRQ